MGQNRRTKRGRKKGKKTNELASVSSFPVEACATYGQIVKYDGSDNMTVRTVITAADGTITHEDSTYTMRGALKKMRLPSATKISGSRIRFSAGDFVIIAYGRVDIYFPTKRDAITNGCPVKLFETDTVGTTEPSGWEFDYSTAPATDDVVVDDI